MVIQFLYVCQYSIWETLLLFMMSWYDNSKKLGWNNVQRTAGVNDTRTYLYVERIYLVFNSLFQHPKSCPNFPNGYCIFNTVMGLELVQLNCVSNISLIKCLNLRINFKAFHHPHSSSTDLPAVCADASWAFHFHVCIAYIAATTGDGLEHRSYSSFLMTLGDSLDNRSYSSVS